MSVLVTGAGAPLAPEELAAVRQVFTLHDPIGMRVTNPCLLSFTDLYDERYRYLFTATHHHVRFACFGCTGSGLIETKNLELAMLQLGMELPEEHMNKLKASVRTHTLPCACSDVCHSRAVKIDTPDTYCSWPCSLWRTTQG